MSTRQLVMKPAFTLFRYLDAESSKGWLVHNFLDHGDASCFYGKPSDCKPVLVVPKAGVA